MVVIVNKYSHEVVGIGYVLEPAEDGVKVDGCIWQESLGVLAYDNVEVPVEIRPGKYLYTPEDGFTLNPRASAPIEAAQRLADLEAAIAAILGGAM